MDYGYDPRTGKRWNVDPKTKSYPHQSPYVFAANSPIQMVDVEGEHDDYYILVFDGKTGKSVHTKLTVENSNFTHRVHYQIHIKDKDGTVKSFDVGGKKWAKISNQFIVKGNHTYVPSIRITEKDWKHGVVIWGKGGEAYGEGNLLDESPIDGAPAGTSSGSVGNGLKGVFEFISGLNSVVEGFIDYFQSKDETTTSTSVPQTENNSQEKKPSSIPKEYCPNCSSPQNNEYNPPHGTDTVKTENGKVVSDTREND